MKQYFFVFTTSIILLSACGEKKKTESSTTTSTTETTTPASTESGDEKTGEFSIDGTTVKGTASSQYFGDKEKGNFSVLCQHNESATSANFELLQITFVNEKDATTNPALKLYDGSQLPMTEPEAGSYTVALSGVGNGFGDQQFTGSDKSTGTVTVSDRTVNITDLVLFSRDGAKKTVSAKIPF